MDKHHSSILKRFQRYWNPKKKYVGLQVMTLGFLVVPVGGGIALLGGIIQDPSAYAPINTIGYAFLYFGWALMISGAITMAFGIATHWIMLFDKYWRH